LPDLRPASVGVNRLSDNVDPGQTLFGGWLYNQALQPNAGMAELADAADSKNSGRISIFPILL
jgi:hypothetical protein